MSRSRLTTPRPKKSWQRVFRPTLWDSPFAGQFRGHSSLQEWWEASVGACPCNLAARGLSMNDFEGDIRQQAGQSQQVDVGFQCIRDIWQMRLHYINSPMNARPKIFEDQ
jgi:hypothetical protein